MAPSLSAVIPHLFRGNPLSHPISAATRGSTLRFGDETNLQFPIEADHPILSSVRPEIKTLASLYGIVDFEDYGYKGRLDNQEQWDENQQKIRDYGAQSRREASTLALLQGMGVDTTNPAQAIEDRKESLWKQVIDPVRVVSQAQAKDANNFIHLELNLPQQAFRTAKNYTFQLELEDGFKVQGKFSPKNWQVIGSETVKGVSYVRVQGKFQIHQPIPEGYHSITITPNDSQASETQQYIVVPEKAYEPEALSHPLPNGSPKAFGPAIQLYSVRSKADHDWGIGDFSTLGQVVDWVAEKKGHTVGVQPLGALNLQTPERASPYFPVSRMYLNPIYIDVTAVPEFFHWKTRHPKEWEALEPRIEDLRKAPLVQYTDITHLKLETLHHAFERFEESEVYPAVRGAFLSFNDTQWKPNTFRGKDFKAFCEERGEALRKFAVFQAVLDEVQGQGWPGWPEEYKNLVMANSTEFNHQVSVLFPEPQKQEELKEKVRFYEYLQWIADDQLQAAYRKPGKPKGYFLAANPIPPNIGRTFANHGEPKLPLGLYLDLPIGSDPGGFDVLLHQNVYGKKIAVGAPPDPLGPEGQNWGFAPLVPHKLRESAYAPLIEVVRSTMKHAGIMRMDHFALVNRLFLIPRGFDTRDGLYVKYNMDEINGILKLESKRNKVLIIGEDLGTVPNNVREAMDKDNLYAYKVTRWERKWDYKRQPYIKPEQYNPRSVAVFSTHDTSTLYGYPSGWFNQHRKELWLPITAEQVAEDTARDRQAVERLIGTMKYRKLVPKRLDLDKILARDPKHLAAYVKGAHEFLASTSSKLALYQFEDALAQEQQVNIPGSDDGPVVKPADDIRGIPVDQNWRRRLDTSIEDIQEDAMVQSVNTAFAKHRKVWTA